MLQFYNNIHTQEMKDNNFLMPCPQTPPALSKFKIVILDAECSINCINFIMIC